MSTISLGVIATPAGDRHSAAENAHQHFFDLSNLPAELRAGWLFCVWQYQPDKHNRGLLKKRPVSALTGKPARTNRIDDFSSLANALKAGDSGKYAGIGRLMQHPVDQIYAIDLDDCVDELGRLNPYAQDLVARANSYAEVTPSGRGIRIYGRSPLPQALIGPCSVKIWEVGAHPTWAELEVQLFLQGQYVTVSGNQVVGTPNDVTSDQDFLQYLLRQNPKKLNRFFPKERAPGAVARRLAATGRSGTQKKATPAPTDSIELPSTKRTNARIQTMIRTNEIFRSNWERRSDKSEKTDSEYQGDLVRHAYVRYQMNQADIVYLLETWCRKHSRPPTLHRLPAWLRDAQAAFEAACASGRVSFRQYSAERQREYRRKRRELQAKNHTTTPVGIGDIGVIIPRDGTGAKSKKIAALSAGGKSQNEIAKELGVSRSTVQTVLRRIRLTATAGTAERKPASFDSSLAKLLYDVSAECGRPIRITTANGVMRKITAYAVELGSSSVVTPEIIRKAVNRTSDLTQKSLVEFLQRALANIACERDLLVLALAKKLQLEGLPSRRVGANGIVQRNRYGFPKAVVTATNAVRALRSYIAPDDFVEDVDEIWRRTQQCGSLLVAIHQIGQERAGRWYELDNQPNTATVGIAA